MILPSNLLIVFESIIVSCLCLNKNFIETVYCDSVTLTFTNIGETYFLLICKLYSLLHLLVLINCF